MWFFSHRSLLKQKSEERSTSTTAHRRTAFQYFLSNPVINCELKNKAKVLWRTKVSPCADFTTKEGGGGENAAVLWLISRSEANLVVFRARERQLTGRSSRRRIRFLLWSRRWSAPVHFLRLRNKMSTPVETPRVGALICSPHSVWCEKSELIPLDDTWKRLLWRWAEYVYAAKCYRIHMQVIWG